MTIEITKRNLNIQFECGDMFTIGREPVEKGQIASVRSNFFETPVINDETYPSKDKSSELYGDVLETLLDVKASDLGSDVTIRDIINYVSTYSIKLMNDDFEPAEKDLEIHSNLQKKECELSKTTIEKIELAAKEEMAVK